MNQIHASFAKIAVGIKTRMLTRSYKIYKVKKKLDEAKLVDAFNMYPDLPSKKKDEKQKPLTLHLR